MFFSSCDELALALAVGVLGVYCATGEGRMCTGNGLFLGWAVALGSKFMGIGQKIIFWGSSPASFPLPPPASLTGSSLGAFIGSYINSS